MQAHHITTQRTARYFTLGTPGRATREVVYAFHGYGQLAERFARRLHPVAGDGRLIVVPEALSRFYVRGSGPVQGEPQVGASWMTREDREVEIADQIRYLDAVHEAVMRSLNGLEPTVSLLGFSQGTATAGRWLARGRARAATLVLWAGKMPPELEPQLGALLAGRRVVVAVGARDELAPPTEVEKELARLRAAGVPCEHLTFDGGHELDADTLRRALPPLTT